jgi:hypothetical protein
MPLRHGRAHALDRLAVTDVADLVLAAQLLGERAQQLLAARDDDRQPVPLGEPPGDRLADAGAPTCDDGDAANIRRDPT